jgi:hypothetical protein
MLHCNMNAAVSMQLGLDDLLADLRHARRQGDLGRLALLAYCEVRRWARQSGELDVAAHSAAMITEEPHASRDAFLEQIDSLIFELAQVHARFGTAGTPAMMPRVERASERPAQRH